MTKKTEPAAAPAEDPREVEGALVPSASTVALLNSSEIDMQIATAHKYPRSVTNFRNEVLTMATLNEDVAAECSYALRRREAGGGEKLIVGPSARFAEVVVSAWGNCRAGARVIDDRGDVIVAQGAFLDLQRNVAVTYEVQRRIVDKNGRRYSADMVSTTANAACAIAMRNAILKGIPKAFWNDLWERARRVAVGDERTLASRRETAFSKIGQFGIGPERILQRLGRASIVDVKAEDLEVLLSAYTSLKESEASAEELFPPVVAVVDRETGEVAPKTGVEAVLARKGRAKAEPTPEPTPTAETPPAERQPGEEG